MEPNLKSEAMIDDVATILRYFNENNFEFPAYNDGDDDYEHSFTSAYGETVILVGQKEILDAIVYYLEQQSI